MIARTAVFLLALAAPVLSSAASPFPKAATRFQAVANTTVFTMLQGTSESSGFAVRALDPAGAGVPGVRVTWTMPAFCGLFGGAGRAAGVTGADGVANPPTFVATDTSMTCTVRADAEGTGMRVDFTVFIYQPADITIDMMPSTVTTTQNGTFSITAELRGAGGVALPGLPVDFEVRPQFAAAARLDRYSGPADPITSTVTVNARGNEHIGFYTIVARHGPAEATVGVTHGATGTGNPGPARTLAGQSPTGSGPVVLMHGSEILSCGFADSRLLALGEEAIPAPPVGLRFPHGLVRARATRCGSTQDLGFTLLLPQAPPAGSAFWRYGPTKANPQPHWHGMPVTVAGTAVTFAVRDGAEGDDDLTVNDSVSLFGGMAYMDAVTTYQDQWWAGPAENGWGGSVFQHGERIFAAFFHYDGAGRPVWSVLNAALDAARTRVSGPLHSATGSPFYAYDPSRFQVTTVGQATLSFLDSERATLDFTLSGGVAARKNLVRQPIGPPVADPMPPRTGLYYGGPARTGFGVSVVQRYDALFVVWFTYDAAGSPTWYVAPAGSWKDGATWTGKAYRTTGAPWAAYDAAALEVEAAGSLTLRFTGADTAVLEYAIDGRTGTESVVRQPL